MAGGYTTGVRNIHKVRANPRSCRTSRTRVVRWPVTADRADPAHHRHLAQAQDHVADRPLPEQRHEPVVVAPILETDRDAERGRLVTVELSLPSRGRGIEVAGRQQI